MNSKSFLFLHMQLIWISALFGTVSAQTKLPPCNGQNPCSTSPTGEVTDKSTVEALCFACRDFDLTTERNQGTADNKLKDCLANVAKGDRNPGMPLNVFGAQNCPTLSSLSQNQVSQQKQQPQPQQQPQQQSQQQSQQQPQSPPPPVAAAKSSVSSPNKITSAPLNPPKSSEGGITILPDTQPLDPTSDQGVLPAVPIQEPIITSLTLPTSSSSTTLTATEDSTLTPQSTVSEAEPVKSPPLNQSQSSSGARSSPRASSQSHNEAAPSNTANVKSNTVQFLLIAAIVLVILGIAAVVAKAYYRHKTAIRDIEFPDEDMYAPSTKSTILDDYDIFKSISKHEKKIRLLDDGKEDFVVSEMQEEGTDTPTGHLYKPPIQQAEYDGFHHGSEFKTSSSLPECVEDGQTSVMPASEYTNSKIFSKYTGREISFIPSASDSWVPGNVSLIAYGINPRESKSTVASGQIRSFCFEENFAEVMGMGTRQGESGVIAVESGLFDELAHQSIDHGHASTNDIHVLENLD